MLIAASMGCKKKERSKKKVGNALDLWLLSEVNRLNNGSHADI